MTLKKSALLIACTVTMVTGQAAELALRDIEGRQVNDAGNADRDVVEVWVDSSAKAPLGSLLPGRYRCVFNGRFIGAPNVRYALTATVEKDETAVATASYRSNQLPADGKFHELSWELTLTEPVTATLSLALQDNAREEDAKAARDKRLGDAARKVTMVGVLDAKGDGLGLELAGPPPKGSDSYLLAGLTWERLPHDLEISRLWPNKIHYYPEESAVVDIAVRNWGREATTTELLVDLHWGLSDSRELLREQITVGPGESIARQIELGQLASYGHELQARIDGDYRREFFSVSENLFEVSIQGWGRVGVLNDQESLRQLSTMPDEQLAAVSRDSAMRNRRGYYNHVEFFSWARDDFFNLAPKQDAWWSGTMTYIKVKRDILAEIRAQQEQGVKVLSYAQPYAIGLDTIDELRSNPEFFAYGGNGAPSVSFDYDLIKSRQRLDMGLRPAEIGGGLNFFNLATVDRGIDAVVASWRMFGWDGVRYDNRYYRANNPLTWAGERATEEQNLDPYSARNVKRQKDRFREEIGPRWLVSHNNGYRFHTEDNRLGWEETVKGGLMCMDEETCSANDASSNLNRWRDYFLFALEARRFCTELGGYYQLFPPGRGNTIESDMLYYIIACAATGSHPISCDVENSPAGHYGSFLTRCSAMLWAGDLQPLSDPDEYLALDGDGSATLWWRSFASQRQVGDRRWLVFPLIVPPADERVGHDPESLTPPAVSVTAQVKTATATDLFLLSPEGGDIVRLLASRAGDDFLAAALPPLAHFGVLVVRTEDH